jgi:hypothetical protein
MTHLKHPVSEAMLNRLRDEAAGYSDFIGVILDDPNSRYGGRDGREALIDILTQLIGLTGSEDNAIAWLFNSRGYTDIVEDDVCVSLAHGGFWTLETLRDWLKVIEAYQDLCPGLIEVVFRRGSVPKPRRDMP